MNNYDGIAWQQHPAAVTVLLVVPSGQSMLQSAKAARVGFPLEFRMHVLKVAEGLGTDE